MTTTEALALDVIDLLRDEYEISATYDYPGLVHITLDERTIVGTGLNGFEYGTISRLDDSGVFQPVDDPAEPEGIDETTTSAREIADAWAEWVRNR